MKANIAIISALSLLAVVSCYKTPEYPIEPHIEFDSYNVTQPYQSLTDGSMFFTFTDGDGDLGLLSGNDQVNVKNIFIKNIKYNLEDTLNMPFIPKKGTSDAISGSIEFILGGPRGGFIDEADLILLQKPVDTLIFDVYIKDRAGHASNVARTPPLVIKTN